MVTATAMFDDALTEASDGSAVEFGTTGNASTGMLMINIGRLEFTQVMDTRLAAPGARIVLMDGSFSGIDFMASPGTNGAPANLSSDGEEFEGSNDLFGEWDLSSVSITPKQAAVNTPEPGTQLLAGLSLTGAARGRRK